MASLKEEDEDGSINVQTPVCSSRQIMRGEEIEEICLVYCAFPAHSHAQGCCGSIFRVESIKLGESDCVHWV